MMISPKVFNIKFYFFIDWYLSKNINIIIFLIILNNKFKFIKIRIINQI